MRRARALLAEGAAPSTAAAEAGFADQAHLTRWFTRTYDVTPAAYRTTLHRESE
ncbi:helix-turn-helix domain-containing protein [Streptomyces sp. P1-3]|uniref:helix-turn-helix domain-containing protein n=1 Tax=Streptomyces sp. P1-3 TaxID=3421658 RepID=UPI003D369447